LHCKLYAASERTPPGNTHIRAACTTPYRKRCQTAHACVAGLSLHGCIRCPAAHACIAGLHCLKTLPDDARMRRRPSPARVYTLPGDARLHRQLSPHRKRYQTTHACVAGLSPHGCIRYPATHACIASFRCLENAARRRTLASPAFPRMGVYAARRRTLASPAFAASYTLLGDACLRHRPTALRRKTPPNSARMRRRHVTIDLHTSLNMCYRATLVELVGSTLCQPCCRVQLARVCMQEGGGGEEHEERI
jgi:hypothetical protein